MTIDLTLKDLQLPGILNFENKFGTKMDDGHGVSTMGLTHNMMMPFLCQRPVEVGYDKDANAAGESNTTDVEYDARLIVKEKGVSLRLGDGKYSGCKITVIGGMDEGECTVKYKGIKRVIEWPEEEEGDSDGSGDASKTTGEGDKQEEKSAEPTEYKTERYDAVTTIKAGDELTLFWRNGSWVSSRDNLIPVGFVYVQLPFMASPALLWDFAKWEDVSAKYKGAFFRADNESASDGDDNKGGGHSAKFGVVQNEGLPNITGQIGGVRCSITGAFRQEGISSEADWQDDVDYYASFDASRCSAIYGASEHVTPINYAVRIWRRVA